MRVGKIQFIEKYLFNKPYHIKGVSKDDLLLEVSDWYKTNQEQLKHPDWNITVSETTLIYKNVSIYSGMSQGINFNLTFKRDSWDHLMHFYLPSLILCTASMMSLFIPMDLLPARMSLAATTCLSMITLVIGAK